LTEPTLPYFVKSDRLPILNAIEVGDAQVAEQLMPLVNGRTPPESNFPNAEDKERQFVLEQPILQR
jgi:hypothetical protein